jgi:hypothetical protein
MPALSQRVASRGYASGVIAGRENVTGEKAYEAIRRPDQSPIDFRTSASTLTGFQPEGVPPLGIEVLEGTWGLPGTLTDDLSSPGYGPGTVRSHAAPMPGWAGGYSNFRVDNSAELEDLHANSREIHAADFGMPARLGHVLADNVAHQPADHWTSNDPGGHTNQAPLSGAQRSMGYLSKDAIQGYDRANGHGFGAGHRDRTSYPGPQDKTHGQPMIYIDPAERPFIVPQAQSSFTPTDAVQGPEPWMSDLHAENLAWHDPSAYAAPYEPATLQAPLGSEAVASAGWR